MNLTLTDNLPTTGRLSAPMSIVIPAPSGEPIGFVEIDRVVAGRCCGGVRMTATVTPDEVRRLARIMTLKCGYLGLASGGAKSGIIGPAGESAGERRARLEAFGRAVAPLLHARMYSLGSDLGTTPEDIET